MDAFSGSAVMATGRVPERYPMLDDEEKAPDSPERVFGPNLPQCKLDAPGKNMPGLKYGRHPLYQAFYNRPGFGSDEEKGKSDNVWSAIGAVRDGLPACCLLPAARL